GSSAAAVSTTTTVRPAPIAAAAQPNVVPASESTWTQRCADPCAGMLQQYGMASATDGITGQVVMSGGYNGRDYPDAAFDFGVSTWDGVAWTHHSAAGPMYGGWMGAMDFDPGSRRVLLLDRRGETWLWD